MKKILRIPSALALSFLLNACAKETINNTIERAPSSGKIEITDIKAWSAENQPFGTAGNLFTLTLTENGREQALKELKETTLESLNLPSTYNVNAFTVRSKGNVKTKEAVYIAPKLYLYKKAEKANVRVKVSGDKVLIPLHAIFVDGLSSQVPAADGINKVDLPPSYLVDKAALKQALIDRNFSENTPFGPLDGCPQKIVLAVGGESYNVTPTDLASASQCEINRPFTINLVVPKDKADFIINEALYLNEVDVYAFFEVLVGYLDSDVKVQIDRSKIFEKLSVSLEGNKPPLLKATVEANLKSLLQNEIMNISIKGDSNKIVDQLTKMAMESMTSSFSLQNDQSAAKATCSTGGCVSLSYSKDVERKYLEYSYQQYSNTLTGQFVSTLAKAQQILFPEVILASSTVQDLNQTSSQKIPYISNLKNNERDLAVNASEGTILELKLEAASVQQDNTTVNMSASQNTRCGSYDFTKRCEYHVFNKVISRSYAGIKFSEWFQPAGNSIGNITSNLSIKMRKANGSSVTCNLDQMNTIANGTSFKVKIENTPTCKIFSINDSENMTVNLSFINNLRTDEQLVQIEDGLAYSHSDSAEKQDGLPSMDESPLGGSRAKKIKKVDREIRLSATIMVRKFDRF